MPEQTITDLLNQWSREDETASREVFDRLYGQLHELASIQVSRGRRNAIVQTTMVLHEAYLKLAERGDIQWADRDHFFAYSARTMRNVLADLARLNASQKRGAGAGALQLEDFLEAVSKPDRANMELADILALHEALVELEKVDLERARIVELRFFAGMAPGEIGEVLELSESTVHRRWRSARAWLYRYLRGTA